MTSFRSHRKALGLGLMLAVVTADAAFAEGASTPPPAMPTTPAKVRVIGADGKEMVTPEAPMTDTDRFCSNIANPALDARNAMQLAEIRQAEGEISSKIDELEAKRAEVEKWLGERRDFINSTSDIVIGIYSGMKPDAAAAQMAALDRPIAASLLTRLKPRQASAILAEMPAPIASELAALIVKKTDRASAEAGAKDQSL